MYQSPAIMEYAAAYKQDEALRWAENERLAHQVDHHSSGQHQLIAAVVALLLVIAVLVVL
jgi:hypothetical protein